MTAATSPREKSGASFRSSLYNEQLIVQSLDQGVWGRDPGVKNELGQQVGEQLEPTLHFRHITMISVGGVVGTGLFLGSAQSLREGGPLGLVLGTVLVSTICFSVMQCLGEVVAYLPLPGGLTQLAERFVSPGMAFAMGWLFWFKSTIVLPAQLAAAAILVGFWNRHHEMNPAIYVAIFIVIISVVNLLGARVYGETEFWLASIKCATIVGLAIVSICLVAGAGVEEPIGTRYWRHPWTLFNKFAPVDEPPYEEVRGLAGHLFGLIAVVGRAIFSFLGVENFGTLAAETKNPRRILPRAVIFVWVTVVVLYLMGALAIAFVCPSDHPDLSMQSDMAIESPFVIAIRIAGIRVLPSVINAVLLLSAISAGSQDLYTSSRALYGLAIAGKAPRIFCTTTASGLPLPAVAVGVAVSFLAFLCVKSGANHIFAWTINAASVSGLMVWGCIAFLYLRFRKGFQVQGYRRTVLPYRSWCQPFAAYWVIGWTVTIVLLHGASTFLKGGWSTGKFVSSYISLPLFIVFLIMGRILARRGMVRSVHMDFESSVMRLREMEVPDNAPRPSFHRLRRATTTTTTTTTTTPACSAPLAATSVSATAS